MKLRDYQQKCIDDLREGFKAGHKHQVLKLPTAAGKTIIAGEIARSVISKGGRFWFVVDRLELVNQTVSVFEKFGLDVAVIQGHHEKTDYRKPVQVITIQTIVKRWKVIDANPEWRPTMLCIDEAHCIFDGHKQMIRMFNNIPIVAFSATPWAKNMGLMYSNLINGVSTAELMEAGYLCKYEAYAPYTPDMKGVKIQAGDYKIDELDKKINTKEITGDVVKEWIKLGENRQTIVFCINIAHSEAVANEFRENGVNAVHVDGRTDTDERRKMIDDFKNSKIKILCNVGIATTGFDCPDATCLVISRPTKSLQLHFQILGRILRVSSCGLDALILDFSGNISRLGWPDDVIDKPLCKGEKPDRNKQKKEEIQKEIKAPKPCIKCGFLFNGLKCPNCGNQYFKNPEITVLEGELKKLTRTKKTPAEKRNLDTSKQDKQSFYSAALGYAKHKKYREGWAANAYRDRFSVWPNAMTKEIGPSTDEFNSFLTAKNIKYAKGMQARTKQDG